EAADCGFGLRPEQGGTGPLNTYLLFHNKRVIMPMHTLFTHTHHTYTHCAHIQKCTHTPILSHTHTHTHAHTHTLTQISTYAPTHTHSLTNWDIQRHTLTLM